MSATHDLADWPPFEHIGWPPRHKRDTTVSIKPCGECGEVMIYGQKHYMYPDMLRDLHLQIQDYFKNLSDEDKALMQECGVKLDEVLL